MKSQETRQILMEGQHKDGLYVFPEIHLCKFPFHSNHVHSNFLTAYCSLRNSTALQSSKYNKNMFISTWHARLGHASTKLVSIVLNKCNISHSMNIMHSVCKYCCMGKSHELPFYDSLTVYTAHLQLNLLRYLGTISHSFY